MELPQSFRKVVVTSLTTDLRKAIEIQSSNLPKLSGNSILVRNRYVGINASDVNCSAGKYFTGDPPFGIGFEAVGEVVDAGNESKHLVGCAVACVSIGAFTEYRQLQPSKVFQIPEPKPEYLPLLVSGITAKLALDMNAQMKAGETVLVTAAAGGTGQFAVQLAKLAGCNVIGTCSSDGKVEFLKSIGCDRVINISKEELKAVLNTEYSNGVDIVYECVGGQTFETCVDALKIGGRLLAIGRISQYRDSLPVGGESSRSMADLPGKLLLKSASVNGFFLPHYPQKWKDAFNALSDLYKEGKLKSFIDQGKFRPEGKLEGIESVPDAVDYMYSRKSIGKVVVDLFPEMTGKV